MVAFPSPIIQPTQEEINAQREATRRPYRFATAMAIYKDLILSPTSSMNGRTNEDHAKRAVKAADVLLDELGF
jgi:hypothetical protein